MLKDLNLHTVYDSSDCDLVNDLISPLLMHSKRYDRGVGYFSSGWLKLASSGLTGFAEKAGAARIIMSPILSYVDWEAIKRGHEAHDNKDILDSLLKTTGELEHALQADTLNALAWLIADDILKIKFAIPTGKLEGGDFHDKFAIFEDANGSRVAIHGSYNDSIHGSLNGESFSVFKSWEGGQVEYVNNHDKRFDRLWNDSNPNFYIFTIPDAVRDNIIRLRKYDRPYQIPSHNIQVDAAKSGIVLRDYQIEAYNSWVRNAHSGVFEMATGTGKTITAIACADKIYNENSNISLLVEVPYVHLIDQWNDELKKFNFKPILCSSEHPDWERKLSLQIQDYNLGHKKNISFVVTHATAATDRFQDIMSRVKPKSRMAIFDEVHSLGSTNLRKSLNSSYEYKLGLSATPQRWYDDNGTKLLMQYFGGVCYSFPLEKAIGQFLVPYKYIPHVIEMTDDEYAQYSQLSYAIAKLFRSVDEVNDDPRLQSLLRQRRALINNAKNKLPILLSLLGNSLKEIRSANKKISHTLFYCPVGEHKRYLKEISDTGIVAREFVYEVSNQDRQKILNQFAEGDIEALVAIKCLDEGVDIPATRLAFIIASTTNPREFIQRRGRVLRKCEGKNEATIHDFIVVPPLSDVFVSNGNHDYRIDILKREMPRFVEFASAAMNEFEAKSAVKDVLKKFGVLYLLDMKSYDIYTNNDPSSLDIVTEV